ncbi:hypothetical protein QBC42DRAFT_259512 [Cladorrhinum samala]|uniref:Uncharacterized protein n=1 Tax=Cladorrhinum samala TaxID=585594 RepID=A0AAV9I0B3_9PEZI|nr:hypothetical protein QBC42DRAFT_259512 [Cladorrhinum samala]
MDIVYLSQSNNSFPALPCYTLIYIHTYILNIVKPRLSLVNSQPIFFFSTTFSHIFSLPPSFFFFTLDTASSLDLFVFGPFHYFIQ